MNKEQKKAIDRFESWVFGLKEITLTDELKSVLVAEAISLVEEIQELND